MRRSAAWIPVLGAVLLALLIANLAVTLRNTRELRQESARVAHTHQVISNLEKLRALATEAQTGVRGFTLSGEPDFARPYEDATRSIHREVDALSELTRENSAQQARIPQVRRNVESLLAVLGETRRLREHEGMEAARQHVVTRSGEREIASLRQIAGEMIAHEQALLRTRSETTREVYRSAIYTATLSGAASVIGLTAFLLLLRRHWVARNQAAFAIAEGAERLRTTLASIGDGVITTDRLARVTGLNGVAEALTGWTAADALGRPLADVFHIVNEATREPAPNPALRALSEGVIVGLANHTLLVARDGRERPIDDSAAPIRCAAGEVVGCVLVFRDVAERRRLERELNERLTDAQMLATIVESSDEAIISKNLDGVILSWNAAAERLFGLSAEQAVGRPVTIIIPEDRIVEEEMILARLRAGERIDRYETVRRRGDGTLISVQLTISPMYDAQGRVMAASKIARDITARRETEERERRLLAEAAEANAKFRAFFDQGPALAGIMDLEGTVIEPNRMAWEACGYTRDQIVGKPFWQGPWWSNAPDVAGRVREACAQAAEGRTFRAELPYYVADGSERFMDLTIQPIYDEAGGVRFVAPTAIDMTARKRAAEALRESEERFRMMADNISQFAWIADAKGWIYWYNRRWYEYTGTTLAEVQGWGWRKVLHPEHVDRVVERLQRAWDTGTPWEDSFPIRGADATYRWFLSRAAPILDPRGRVLRWFGTNTDITEQRQLEDDLRALAADLAISDRHKTEFLAMLAHELRNPLAPIRNGVEILRREPADGQLAQGAVEMVARQVEQMVRLIDDLLDLSRISSGKFELRRAPLDLAELVRVTAQTSRGAIESAGQQLVVALPEHPLPVDGDAVRLTQVIANLLSNASKYSERGDRIDVAARREGDEAVVSVRDTGVGIAADMLPRIFAMFAQVNSSLERSQGGLGVGLTLVERIVKLHGGSVKAFSGGPGQGSEFEVRLPAAAVAAPPPTEAAPPSAAPSASRRILVVDDNRDSATSLALLLRLQGNSTRTAHDGLEAVAVAEEFRPDVVLLDIGLPKLNGYDAARRIREQSWGKAMRIVALTGWGQDEDRRKSQEAGFDAHLVKPVEHAALTGLLDDLSAKAR